MRYNTNPLQKSQTYVPKCLSATSASDVLNGAEGVEDFSSNCWLQDHLHQFSDRLSLLGVPGVTENPDTDNDDSIHSQTGSDVTTETDESDDYFLEDPDFYDYQPILRFPSGSISQYMMVQEPPPYGFDEPPPSYEEAITGHVDRISLGSSESSDFVLY